MILSKNKVKMKCECGQVVSDGSVFCPDCRAGVSRSNAKVIKREEKKYQKRVKGKGRKKKK